MSPSYGAAPASEDIYGYVDRTGQWATPPLFSHAGAVVDGAAVVFWQDQPYLLTFDTEGSADK